MDAEHRKSRPTTWSLRIVAVAMVAAAACAVWLAVSLAQTEGATDKGPSATQLIVRGRTLNHHGHPRKAAQLLREAARKAPADMDQRVLATTYYELGVALRKSGHFGAAKTALKRSRKLGIQPATVGLELIKARERIRR